MSKKTQMLIQLEPDQKERIEAAAEEWGISQSSLVRQFVQHGLDRLDSMRESVQPVKPKDVL